MNEWERKTNSSALLQFMNITKEELIQSAAFSSFVEQLHISTYQDGDWIIREGDSGDSFYIIDQGSVEIIKESEANLSLSLLKPGDFFGELALFTGNPRAASAVARGQVVLFSMTKAYFEELIQQFPHMNGTILKQLYDRLKLSYQRLEEKNKSLEESQQIRVELSFIFTSVILVISTFAFFLNLFQSEWINRLPQAHTILYIGSRFIEFVTLLCIIMILVKSKLPIRSFGLTVTGWKKSVIESLLISTAVIGLVTALKYIIVEYTSIDLFREHALVSFHYVDWTYFTYLFVAPLQEFIARGVFQGSIQRLLPGASSKFWAIMMTAFVFGALHLHSSFSLGVAALVSSWLWGWMYSRHQTLIGVGMSHFLIGNYIGLLGVWEYL